MVEILSKPLDIERIVKEILSFGYPCFDSDVGRDEVADSPSFFVYMDDGGLEPSTHANQYIKSFILMFISREGATFDELELIEKMKLCRLVFDRSEIERGSLLNTEEQAVARTLTFHQVIKVER
ncbi:hypothetical protein ACVR1I_06635 [Streptococcus cameli]